MAGSANPNSPNNSTLASRSWIREISKLLFQHHVQNGQLIDGFENDIQSILQTHNLCYGPQKYCDRIWRKFIFGYSEHTAVEKMDGKIQSLILGRDVVLVVHGGNSDLQFLARLRISIRPIHILGTQKAAQTPLQLTYRPSLESFLTTFQIPFVRRSLHIAGNDANYALRTLLMIAVRCSEQEEGLNCRQRIYFKVLQALAQSPPPPLDENCI